MHCRLVWLPSLFASTTHLIHRLNCLLCHDRDAGCSLPAPPANAVTATGVSGMSIGSRNDVFMCRPGFVASEALVAKCDAAGQQASVVGTCAESRWPVSGQCVGTCEWPPLNKMDGH